MDATVVRALVDLRDRTLQKSRVAFGLRISAVDRGADQMDADQLCIIQHWQERFEELESEADEQIKELVKDETIVQAMTNVKGVGLLLAAKVVAVVDIEKADTASALWRYAGYAVKDGKREKPTKGEKLPYNARLKTTCYLIGSSFLKCNSPYRRIYDDARDYYLANRPDWTKNHQHLAAMRKMIKIWLMHLWLVWRGMYGLPTRAPYVEERLGHSHILLPEEFGWEIAKKKE